LNDSTSSKIGIRNKTWEVNCIGEYKLKDKYLRIYAYAQIIRKQWFEV